jgi:hypothetical protein
MEYPKDIDKAILEPDLKLFIEGPPGTGKTTLAVRRLRHLIELHSPDTSILVLLPHRLLASPFHEAVRDPDLGPSISVDILSFDGLARRILRLFWPLIGADAGFAFPHQAPVFLTVESAQYFLRLLIDPLADEAGYFANVTIERSRLVSQLLDNLNKAALVGISIDEVFDRLRASWAGESAHLQMFTQAHDALLRFRLFCLSHNLLDFSLQIDTFSQHLFVHQAVQAYLFDRYRHLIVDNLEEDTPVLHDLLLQWIPHAQSAVLVQDREGGHRVFMGADPTSAQRLVQTCSKTAALEESLVASEDIRDLSDQIGAALNQRINARGRGGAGDFRNAVEFSPELRYHHEMLDWVVQQAHDLVTERRVSPGRIVIVAPFVSDALRFSLLTKLDSAGLPAASYRASRPLRDEPSVRCLLTLARVAHPWWGDLPSKYDLVTSLMEAIQGLDLVRAHLLASVVYRPHRSSEAALSTFAEIQGELRQRITVHLGTQYDFLRHWLLEYVEAGPDNEAPLDVFLSRLLGEVLAQPGFGFHPRQGAGLELAAGAIEEPSDMAQAVADALHPAAELLASTRKFRQELESIPELSLPGSRNIHILRMIDQGAIAATHVSGWQQAWKDQEKILLAPIHTYLMSNRPVDFQFWLDVGSAGWWERIYQPLTHPYVLRRDWVSGRKWTDEDEYLSRQETLARIVFGLTHRCRRGIFLAYSMLNEQGYEHRGPLLQALQIALRRKR